MDQFSHEIKGSLKQVNLALNHFLDNVAFIYRTIGIYYDVKQLADSFMRLLIPPETIPVLNFRIVKDYLEKNEKSSLSGQNFGQSQRKVNEFDGHQTSYYQHKQEQKFVQSQSFKIEEEAVKIHESQNEDDNDQGISKRFNSNQHRVDKELEQTVYRWAMSEFDRGERVQMVAICKYARKMSKNKQFLGSTGWCSNFLNRYPKLKRLVKNKLHKNLQNSQNQNDNLLSQKLSGRLATPKQNYQETYRQWDQTVPKNRYKYDNRREVNVESNQENSEVEKTPVYYNISKQVLEAQSIAKIEAKAQQREKDDKNNGGKRKAFIAE